MENNERFILYANYNNGEQHAWTREARKSIDRLADNLIRISGRDVESYHIWERFNGSKLCIFSFYRDIPK